MTLSKTHVGQLKIAFNNMRYARNGFKLGSIMGDEMMDAIVGCMDMYLNSELDDAEMRALLTRTVEGQGARIGELEREVNRLQESRASYESQLYESLMRRITTAFPVRHRTAPAGAMESLPLPEGIIFYLEHQFGCPPGTDGVEATTSDDHQATEEAPRLAHDELSEDG
jgi:hypothetical protein